MPSTTSCRRTKACARRQRYALRMIGGYLPSIVFPAEHLLHMQTTNPIESTLTMIRHWTDQAKSGYAENKERLLAVLSAICQSTPAHRKNWGQSTIRSYLRITESINRIENFWNRPSDICAASMAFQGHI